MDPVDGNAIAGDLCEVFGEEMTAETGVCRSCGTAGQIGELHVYTRAPGAVARCRNCGSVVFVLVQIAERTRIYLDGYTLSSGRTPAGGEQ